MPRIQLTPVQRGLFLSTNQNAKRSVQDAQKLADQAAELSKQAKAIREVTSKIENEALLAIGKEHGVLIPPTASVDAVEGEVYFSWPDAAPAPTPSSAKRQLGKIKKKRAVRRKAKNPQVPAVPAVPMTPEAEPEAQHALA